MLFYLAAYWAFGTRHPAPGTRHPSPVTRHPAPGTRNPEPGTRNAAIYPIRSINTGLYLLMIKQGKKHHPKPIPSSCNTSNQNIRV
jgi:hypothetical protein